MDPCYARFHHDVHRRRKLLRGDEVRGLSKHAREERALWLIRNHSMTMSLLARRVGIMGLHRRDVGERLGVELKLRRSDVLLELRHCRCADDRRAEKPPAL